MKPSEYPFVKEFCWTVASEGSGASRRLTLILERRLRESVVRRNPPPAEFITEREDGSLGPVAFDGELPFATGKVMPSERVDTGGI